MNNIIQMDKKREKIERKKALVFEFVLNFYKEIKETGVDIPYFLKARDWYNNNVKDIKSLNYWYKKITENRNT